MNIQRQLSIQAGRYELLKSSNICRLNMEAIIILKAVVEINFKVFFFIDLDVHDEYQLIGDNVSITTSRYIQNGKYRIDRKIGHNVLERSKVSKTKNT